MKMRNLSYMKFCFLIFFIFTMFISGCTGQEGTKGVLSVSPDPVVLTLNSSLQFSVAPAGTAVKWSIKEDPEKLLGAIDSTGLYKAPSNLADSPEKVNIIATDSSGNKGGATAFLTTFNANKRISINYAEGAGRSDTYSSGQKSLAVFKDGSGNVNIYTVWADNSLGISQVWFSKSSDNGTSFSLPATVAASLSGKQISPSIAVDNSGKVYIVWEDYREGDADILMSIYDGTSFGSIKKINTDIGDSVDYDSSPSIALSDSGDVCIVWEHRDTSIDHYPDIYFARSTDFSTPVIVTNSGRRPSIAIDPAGIAYVVWEDLTGFPDHNSPTHIMMRTVAANNTTPNPTEQVDSITGTNVQARYPSVTITPDGKKIYVVWQRAEVKSPAFENESTLSYDIDLAVTDVAAGTTTNYLSIPDSTNNTTGYFGGHAYPSIASDSNNVYIVWDDERNGSKDVYFSRSAAKNADGVKFTTNRIVNDEPGTWHEKPSVAVLDGKAYVIWTDYRNTSLVTSVSPSDVFFARE